MSPTLQEVPLSENRPYSRLTTNFVYRQEQFGANPRGMATLELASSAIELGLHHNTEPGTAKTYFDTAEALLDEHMIKQGSDVHLRASVLSSNLPFFRGRRFGFTQGIIDEGRAKLAETGNVLLQEKDLSDHEFGKGLLSHIAFYLARSRAALPQTAAETIYYPQTMRESVRSYSAYSIKNTGSRNEPMERGDLVKIRHHAVHGKRVHKYPITDVSFLMAAEGVLVQRDMLRQDAPKTVQWIIEEAAGVSLGTDQIEILDGISHSIVAHRNKP